MAIQAPRKRWSKRLERSRVLGHGAQAKKQTHADLLITPLVDTFVILALFLIANFSATGAAMMETPDIRLPEAAHVREIELAPVVLVSNDLVILDGQVVGRVAELTHEDFPSMPALEEKLRDLEKKYVDLHALAQDGAQSAGFPGDVDIQADKGVPFGVIKRVMFSCSAAGYANINFLAKPD